MPHKLYRRPSSSYLEMRLVLGLDELPHQAVELGADDTPRTAVDRALEHLRRLIAGGEWIPPVPRFLPPGRRRCVADADLVLRLEPGDVLVAEARRQGCELEQLAIHAVFLHLADLDRRGS